MAIQFMENFQLYAYSNTSIEAAGTPWTFYGVSVSGSTGAVLGGLKPDPDPSAPAGSMVLVFNNNYADAMRINLPTPQQAIGIAARIWLDSLPGDREHGAAVQFN